MITQTGVARSPEAVWRELEQIEQHVSWMRDAVAIRFVGPTRRGVGTKFDCDTKVGPIRLTDRMEIERWEENSIMSVSHRGAVSGSGQFTLVPQDDGSTIVRWEERLTFPWWLGGGVGALFARPIFTLLWRGNLSRLRKRIEDGS